MGDDTCGGAGANHDEIELPSNSLAHWKEPASARATGQAIHGGVPGLPHKSPAEAGSAQRSSGFGGNNLLGDGFEIWPNDIRLGAEGVQHFSWPGDKGRRTSRSQRPHDIPRMRRHEPQTIDGK